MKAGPEISTTDLFDAAPDQVRPCDIGFHLYGTRRSFAGPCATLRAADHFPVGEMLREPGRGRVLVIDQIEGPVPVAMLGDRLAELALENGWQAVVVNGWVRDTSRLSDLPIPIAARATTPRRADKASSDGERDGRISLGGAFFSPDLWIAGDEDGIVSCPSGVFRRL